MSRREKVGNWFKELKGDAKTLFGRKEGISRPTTPGALPRTDSVVRSTGEDAIRLSATSVQWKGLKELARVLEPVTNLFGPVKEVVDMFVGCVETYQASSTIAEVARAEYDEVQAHLEGLLHNMAGYFSQSSSLTMTKSMESICGSIKQELETVSAKLGRTIGVRYLEAGKDVDTILGCYRRIESHLRRLMLNANMEMWKVIEEQAAESRSDRMSFRVNLLPSALPAWYNSAEGIELKRRACTAGTRVDVLATILHWTCSPGDGAVYWLNGMAGTGKTTIAYSVCAELDRLHHLGASFFCSRLREECRNVNMIIPSIAYQLAQFSRPFQSALSQVLEKDPDVHGRQPHYSPNGSLIASSSADWTIILWDASTGKQAIAPLTGHSHWVRSVSFSPDSTRLVSGSRDNTIQIWDTQTGEMLFKLSHTHEGEIMLVEYSPDGTRVLSRSKQVDPYLLGSWSDTSVQIHDARSPQERAQMRSESEVGDWTMDKDGWVVDDKSRLLAWVPGDLRKALISPSTLQVRDPWKDHLHLEFDGSRIGESWEKGYASNI